MICKQCNADKAVSEFYRSNRASCKQCHCAQVRLRRLTDPKVRQYDRGRSKTPERRAKNRVIATRWREEHPEAYQAQTAVGNAVRDGKLKKLPCEVCGAEANVHAHHSDYSRPLDVKWLCARCHHRLHALFPQLRGHEVSL